MIKLYEFDELRPEQILNRDIRAEADVEAVVDGIIADVRAEGDKALYRYAEKFDHVVLNDLLVSEEEMAEGLAQVDPDFITTLEMAAANIRHFHEAQKHKNFVLNDQDGILLGQKYTPIQRAGVYVPGGTASYPSTVLMDVIPAKIAGVEQIVMTTPAGKDGKIAPAILAAAHVLVLAVSSDLGGALLFFVTYLVMLYVATKKPLYFLAGLGAGSVAAVIGYHLFAHVRVRVLAWTDPFSVIENEGYQITQSLFAIGTGRWFGMGLNLGMPNKIPVVEQDFIFSAIAEEMGGIFAVCLILICMSCFIMFINIAMQIKNRFYKYTALGFGTLYGFQVFLTIGGAIRFIPSTGVTLPLVSYGGSSLASSILMFYIIQGMYLLKEDEDLQIEKERAAKARKAKRVKDGQSKKQEKS